VVVIDSFRKYLLEIISRFVFIRAAFVLRRDITRVIRAVRNDVNVVLLLVLLCMNLWLVGFSTLLD
jgi:hypothetical protein